METVWVLTYEKDLEQPPGKPGNTAEKEFENWLEVIFFAANDMQVRKAILKNRYQIFKLKRDSKKHSN